MTIEPLSAATLEGLRRLHQPIPGKVLQGEFCAIDREHSPCQTARLLATIDRLTDGFREFAEFVRAADPAILDAFEFTQNVKNTGYIEYRTTACHAGSDGDCSWPDCPQTRDGEPMKSGRDCPLLSEPPA